MVNLKETRHQLAHKYDIAAEDLDPSIIPILMAIDNMANRLEKSVNGFQHQSKQIETLMKQEAPPIYCDHPKTALILGIGKYGSIFLGISIFLSVFWMGLVMLKSNEKQYAHYKHIAKVIQFDEQSGSYFIRKEDYKKVEKGIVIK